MNQKRKKWMFIILLLLICIVWILWANTALETNYYTISNEKLPTSFHGYRIALITDLHNCEIGENNIRLLKTLQETDPDMIAIVGDIVDCYHTDISISLNFANQAATIAPTFYVAGNHESFIKEYDQLEVSLSNGGVSILHNEVLKLEQNGEYIQLIGLDDPSFEVDYFTGDTTTRIDTVLEQIDISNDTFSLLLSHRPELFDIYVKHHVDLALSGHAHGGQFRLPFIGGLYAPNQGILPTYDSGLYSKNKTDMIVSRGIGNSRFPIRFNNRPEVIIIELQTNTH